MTTPCFDDVAADRATATHASQAFYSHMLIRVMSKAGNQHFTPLQHVPLELTQDAVMAVLKREARLRVRHGYLRLCREARRGCAGRMREDALRAFARA
jgi:hypothetical protein